jgi:hypothetical protein
MKMASLARVTRIGLLPALLWAVSCMNDSEGGDKPPAAESNTSGYFRIRLNEKSEISQGIPTVEGRVYAGVSPSAILWVEKSRSGACALYQPKAPFCDPGCGTKAVCVEDGVCKAFARPIVVGKVTLTGAKTKAGETSFAMDPTNNVYQVPAGTNLDYTPFAEGDEVKVSAAGDTALGSFAIAGKAIARLNVLSDTIVLADGKPIHLSWTPPAKEMGTSILVEVDISHHGGSKGKISCETADNGSLDIAAPLVDNLKALGVSGFPRIELTRKSVTTHPQTHVNLEIESPITKLITVPGVISCTTNEECPDGKTCQQDMQCK